MSESRKTIKLKSKNENKNKIFENNTNGEKKFDKKFKLKFNKYLLIELLKKTRLRKLSEKKNKAKNSNSSRFNNFNNTEKQFEHQTFSTKAIAAALISLYIVGGTAIFSALFATDENEP